MTNLFKTKICSACRKCTFEHSFALSVHLEYVQNVYYHTMYSSLGISAPFHCDFEVLVSIYFAWACCLLLFVRMLFLAVNTLLHDLIKFVTLELGKQRPHVVFLLDSFWKKMFFSSYP